MKTVRSRTLACGFVNYGKIQKLILQRRSRRKLR